MLQLKVDHSALPANDTGNPSPDRRGSPRHRTVFRTSRIVAGGREGLARIHNISDDGMMLSTTLPIDLNDRVRIDLSDVQSVAGSVVWINGQQLGVKLDMSVNSCAVLRQLVADQRAGRTRPARISADTTALATSELGIRAVRIRDVSQRGVKVAHDGSFRSGLSVKITFPSGIERRGIVRWSSDSVAGIELVERFMIDELGRTDLL